MTKAEEKAIERARKAEEKLAIERARIETLKVYEKEYEAYGYVCGIDEVGRGPLAGPVVAGAVILPKDCDILYLNDSKKLSEKKREMLYVEYGYICGIDEVGRGPLAGPVVAGAVILPKDCQILYINDSKKLSEKKREELYDVIMKEAVAVGIGYASCERIDEINILQATYEAMREAISNLMLKNDYLCKD